MKLVDERIDRDLRTNSGKNLTGPRFEGIPSGRQGCSTREDVGPVGPYAILANVHSRAITPMPASSRWILVTMNRSYPPTKWHISPNSTTTSLQAQAIMVSCLPLKAKLRGREEVRSACSRIEALAAKTMATGAGRTPGRRAQNGASRPFSPGRGRSWPPSFALLGLGVPLPCSR